MLKINLEYKTGILVCRLSGNLNKATSYKLNRYLIPVIMKHGIKFLVYNLEKIENIDKIGKKALINGNKAISSNKGFAYICAIPKDLKIDLKDLPIQKTNSERNALKLLAI